MHSLLFIYIVQYNFEVYFFLPNRASITSDTQYKIIKSKKKINKRKV